MNHMRHLDNLTTPTREIIHEGRKAFQLLGYVIAIMFVAFLAVLVLVAYTPQA